MSGLLSSLQPAVKKETKNVLIYTVLGVIVMFIIFLVLHLIFKETVPFDYTVILGGICCGFIAVLNFFLMAITVQKVANTENEDDAKKLMKFSYSRRLILQLIWIVVSIFAPCFNVVAGLVPLMFPGLGIKLSGTIGFKKIFKKVA